MTGPGMRPRGLDGGGAGRIAPFATAPALRSAPGRHFGPRPSYREESEQRILGGCGLMGVCDQSGARMSGELALRSMASMHDRGNGLGGGTGEVTGPIVTGTGDTGDIIKTDPPWGPQTPPTG